MYQLAFKRIKAFLLDYLLLLVYIFSLLAATLAIMGLFNLDGSSLTPVTGQLLGFFTLTLPVILYFYFTESGQQQASFGKRKMKLRVKTDPSTGKERILFRNVLKFLPWEIAHTGVHWLFYFGEQDLAVPLWVWSLLIGAQLLVIIYLISLFNTTGRSVYDRLAGTRVLYYSSPESSTWELSRKNPHISG